jgi:hypothetical protein
MIEFSKRIIKPLETLTITTDGPGTVRVFDAEHRLYHQTQERQFDLTVSGALGSHTVCVCDESGEQRARETFRVDCQTELQEESGVYSRLMHMLKTTFIRKFEGNRNTPTDEDRVYRLQSVTSRDTVHVHKGSLYFIGGAKDVIDLFEKYQPEDGMVWDFGISVTPGFPYHFEWRWGEQFSLRTAGGKLLFARQPVMNDLEHMYIRGIWQSWRATGDDDWMKSKLDSALAAMNFSRTSEYFWSEEYQLLKRPLCVDLWDFQSTYDADLVGGDEMDAKPGVSVYGVFHGDNTGMADACGKLAQMLRFAGREDDAKDAQGFADHIYKRLEEVAWNGEFYTHHVSEDPSFKRDMGVDESKQVSLSNSYALSRGIGHDKCVAIIKTYQRIREEMPESSPAEWFGIYPPFEKGFHIPAWWYCNGGVTIMTGGELAKGAFEHGFENYGSDILRRTVELFSPHGDAFVGGLRGKAFEPPARSFQTLDLRRVANADLVCKRGQSHPGFTDEPGMDLRNFPVGRQEFEDVPFEILSGDENDGKALLRIHPSRPGYAVEACVDVQDKIGSLYLLHACSGGGVAGELSFVYEDGSEVSQYIKSGSDVLPFWNPTRPRQHRRKAASTIVAWTGANERFWRVGICAHGINNPCPEKKVKCVRLRAGKDGVTWLVLGATTSDASYFFQPDETEPSGVPPRWGAGAMMYALVEGLCGAYDADRNFKTARIAPRWASADVNGATVALRYVDGGGYIRYRYRREGNTLRLQATGNAESRRIEMLLPEGTMPVRAVLNGDEVPLETLQVEQSNYVCVRSEQVAVTTLEVEVRDK